MLNSGATVMPALFKAKALDARGRLSFWVPFFDVALGSVQPLIITTSIACAAAAYFAPVHKVGLLGVSERALWIATTVLALSPAPYTAIVMLPGITRMKKIDSKTIQASDAQIDELLKKWTAAHHLRTLAFLVAAAVSASSWL